MTATITLAILALAPFAIVALGYAVLDRNIDDMRREEAEQWADDASEWLGAVAVKAGCTHNEDRS